MDLEPHRAAARPSVGKEAGAILLRESKEQGVAGKESNWKFAEDFVVERAEIVQARQHSIELGIDPVSPATGAQLAVIAAAAAAKNIIEIGTGVGVSGLWFFAGAPHATLTSIDFEQDYQQSAKKAFLDSGVSAKRIRLIAGRAIDVLPRMNEQSYDIVLVDADPQSVIRYVEHALRLVRTGGTVLVAHALWRGRVADPAQRDDTATGFRSLLTEIAASDAVISSLSPVGDGLLQLTKLAAASADG
jgi:predicted O-methyltransferase YrrM